MKSTSHILISKDYCCKFMFSGKGKSSSPDEDYDDDYDDESDDYDDDD